MIDLTQFENLHWRDLDTLFTYCRRKMFRNPKYRYGPLRVHEVANKVYLKIAKYANIEDANYCEVGCGIYHPFGIAAIMYLNGANSITAVDKNESNHQRAAEALYDLLIDCSISKEKWLWSKISDNEYYRRIRDFNLSELRNGNLFAGLKNINCQYLVRDVQEKFTLENKIDILSSWAMLEHVEHLDVALQNIYENMSNGGIAFHLIGLQDHRAYRDLKYNFWSFLTEEGSFSDFNCNRLRVSEVLSSFENSNYKILDVNARKDHFPIGIQQLLLPKYANMTIDELETVSMSVTSRRELY